jgi:Flp pilus assembly protein TadG
VTLLVGFSAVLLSCALVAGAADVAGAVVDRSRAQTAADAAALAAASDSAFGGSGSPAASAAEYARLNGARLIHCLCRSGATAAQVEVGVGDATATARAVFDPARVLPAGDWATGLDLRLAAAVEQLLRASRGRVFVVSGARSSEQQQTLWDEAVDRYGDAEAADDWVARPGSSSHERGVAVDLGGDLELAASLIERFELPLVRPLPHEPWHFELG